MAEDKKHEDEEVVQEKKKSGSLMLIIIIVVLIVVILVGAIVAILMMGGEEKAAEHQEGKVIEKEVQQEEGKPEGEKKGAATSDRTLDKIGTLFELEDFTVNLLSENGSHYLKAKISLELSEPKMAEELEVKKPVIRDKILRILSSKSLEEVSTLKGKEKLGEEMMQELNGMLKDGSINGVYFTDFVIQ